MSDLLLDSRIRDWVLLPLCWLTFLIGILRHFVTVLMTSPTEQDDKAVRATRASTLLTRSQLFREHYHYLFPNAIRRQRSLLAEPETGALQEVAKEQRPTNPMQQMNNMMGMMAKSQVAGYLPHILMMMFVNAFFSGFVLARVPFAVHSRLKPLFSREVDLPSLSSSYITSLSLYMLLMFGLRGVYSLTLDDGATTDEAALIQQQQQAMAQTQVQNPAKQFLDEAEAARLVPEYCSIPLVEDSALRALAPRISAFY
eukprot:TRINITY_DN6861_c0_g1_i1.p1 TRINITY_DN6861_c0_g1~~TRINITY_DN6861_c0_g1_i1.p1  ORF type:complete len:289 (-),score=52.61 TRINITY_DN6861_c0_g1_i1:768-1535(-)